MKNFEARKVFDSIITQPIGAKITIPCENRTDQESTRVQLWRERKAYDAKFPDANVSIGIQRLTVNEVLAEELGTKYIVIINVNAKRLAPILTLPDGTEEKVSLTATPEPIEHEELSPEQQRAYNFMIGDGIDSAIAMADAKEMYQ